jgi:hypothetical protein
MPRRFATAQIALALAAAAALAAPAHAGDPFTDAVQAACAPYRSALFRTNSQAQAESEQAVAQARQAWAAVVGRFGTQPPAPYDRDPRFAASLAEIDAAYERAATQVGQRRLAEAHETLEAVRDLLADLRRRSQVIVYSDHMNAYHAEMEHVLGEGPKLLAQPQGAMELLARTGALDYLAGRLESEAPEPLRADPEFAKLLAAVRQSVAALKSALVSGDGAAARAALGQIKKPYSQLFLKFG